MCQSHMVRMGFRLYSQMVASVSSVGRPVFQREHLCHFCEGKHFYVRAAQFQSSISLFSQVWCFAQLGTFAESLQSSQNFPHLSVLTQQEALVRIMGIHLFWHPDHISIFYEVKKKKRCSSHLAGDKNQCGAFVVANV